MTAEEQQADIRLSWANWCRLLAHQCDGLDGACSCRCHA